MMRASNGYGGWVLIRLKILSSEQLSLKNLTTLKDSHYRYKKN